MIEKTNGLTRREFVRQVGLGAAALAAASTTPLELSIASTIKNGMGYRTLGRTGLEISEVGLGAGSISPSGSNLIRAALSQGINFIETSSNYRNSQVETAIGQVVKSMGIRDKVFILTKAGNLEMGRMLDVPASEVEKAVRAELEASLKRLQTDYVDVYTCPYMAFSPKEVALPALQEALEKFKKEGKIRFKGLSTHSDYANICMTAIDGGYYDVLQFPVNFATVLPHIRNAVLEAKKAEKSAGGEGGRKGEGGFERPIIDVREVLKAAQQKNVGIVAMKGAQEAFLPPFMRDQVKNELAKDTRLSFHQFAYRFVLDQPQVSTVTIRMANMLHLNEALVLSQKTLKG
jgi:aryl-alcohol dehydrogenase-like predicted oxidoreductase